MVSQVELGKANKSVKKLNGGGNKGGHGRPGTAGGRSMTGKASGSKRNATGRPQTAIVSKKARH